MMIDDKIPINPASKATAFAKYLGPERGLWNVVLEKVFAKRWGSYNNLSDGYTTTALHTMAGMPFDFLATQEYKKTEWGKSWPAEKVLSKKALCCLAPLSNCGQG